MNNKASIAFALVTALAATTIVAPDARADLANDRVLLQAGSSFGCTGTGTRGFFRIYEDPDGSQTYSTSTEFRVPAGYYLEISNLEYATPYYMMWAKGYSQSIDFGVRSRTTTTGTSVFSARYQNGATYAGGDTTWDTTNEYVAPGAETRSVSFPHGPLMSSNARLCVTGASNYWLYTGSFGAIRVRGRLVPTGEPVISPIDPPTNSL